MTFPCEACLKHESSNEGSVIVDASSKICCKVEVRHDFGKDGPVMPKPIFCQPWSNLHGCTYNKIFMSYPRGP